VPLAAEEALKPLALGEFVWVSSRGAVDSRRRIKAHAWLNSFAATSTELGHTELLKNGTTVLLSDLLTALALARAYLRIRCGLVNILLKDRHCL
jgi:hypothetical protein